MNSKLIFNIAMTAACGLFANILTPVHSCQTEEPPIQQEADIIPAQRARIAVRMQQPTPAEDVSDQTDETKESSGDESITDSALQTAVAPIDDRFIRFHMWDGSIMGGEVTVEKIEVQTEFGSLQIPIKDIEKFYPGLDSIPALSSKIETLVKGLGDQSYDVREQSHRELLAMGMQLRHEVHQFDDGGSAERKKHLENIKKQIDEMSDDLSEIENEDVERPMIRGDVIVTPEFSIVGKIRQPDFKLNSKFGELSVSLADIRMADRTFNQKKSEIRKSVEVSGMAFFQTKPASTKIRVNRGDKISIRATGVVKWTNWNSTSDPDGIDSQGQWQGENCGTLMARIGNENGYVKIGSSCEFTAKQSGELFLGIGMRDNYASNNGYRWEGNYDAKIVVQPAK